MRNITNLVIEHHFNRKFTPQKSGVTLLSLNVPTERRVYFAERE